jgi:hypothetical protein
VKQSRKQSRGPSRAKQSRGVHDNHGRRISAGQAITAAITAITPPSITFSPPSLQGGNVNGPPGGRPDTPDPPAPTDPHPVARARSQKSATRRRWVPRCAWHRWVVRRGHLYGVQVAASVGTRHESACGRLGASVGHRASNSPLLGRPTRPMDVGRGGGGSSTSTQRPSGDPGHRQKSPSGEGGGGSSLGPPSRSVPKLLSVV